MRCVPIFILSSLLAVLLSVNAALNTEVPTSESNSACLNPAVITGHFEDIAVNSSQFALRGAYVMQRHCDRWLYEHDLIQNVCWPRQLNSSKESSPLMASECSDVPSVNGTLKTVWQDFPPKSDPYSRPLHGSCQVTQGSRQGREHARMWGEMLKKQYVDSGLVPKQCPPGSIALHTDKVHKNELTLETEYSALCGQLPTLEQFPRETTLVGYVEKLKKGTPWYAAAKQCAGPRLEQLDQKAKQAMLESEWWKAEVQAVAAEAADAAGHRQPRGAEAAGLLSSISDCVMVHACTGLPDTPAAFLDSSGLPDLRSSALFSRMSGNVTGTWTWAFDYFRSIDPEAFREYASLYYGYFFGILADQLVAAVEGEARAPKLTITVMSCDNISPQLALYGLSAEAVRWPPYLSSLIHEVYEDKSSGKIVVRVLFDGRVMRVCSSPGSFPLCPLDEWLEIIRKFVPTRSACPSLYEGYEFLSGESMLADEDTPAAEAVAQPHQVAVLGVTPLVLACLALVAHSCRRVGEVQALMTPLLARTTDGGVDITLPEK